MVPIYRCAENGRERGNKQEHNSVGSTTMTIGRVSPPCSRGVFFGGKIMEPTTWSVRLDNMRSVARWPHGRSYTGIVPRREMVPR